MTDAPPPDTHWSLDKRVNIGLIVGLIIQTIALSSAGIWYAAKVDARIVALETTDVRIIAERDIRRKAVDDRFEFMARDRDRLIRVETQIEGIAKSIGRIETKLDNQKP